MDKILLIKIGLILLPFVVLCIYSLIDSFKITLGLNKKDKKVTTKRKITKREDSNIYDLKTRRR